MPSHARLGVVHIRLPSTLSADLHLSFPLLAQYHSGCGQPGVCSTSDSTLRPSRARINGRTATNTTLTWRHAPGLNDVERNICIHTGLHRASRK